MVRDEKIERLIQIVGDLYIYLLDGVSIQKILTYKTTLERVLSQTSECAYFIGNYQELKPFGWSSFALRMSIRMLIPLLIASFSATSSSAYGLRFRRNDHTV